MGSSVTILRHRKSVSVAYMRGDKHSYLGDQKQDEPAGYTSC